MAARSSDGARTARAAIRRSHLSRRLLAALLVLALLGIPGAVVAERTCSEPLDVSGTTRLPEPVAEAKNRDELAYPAHVVAGTVLEALGCQPTAVALQWLKAAAHARTDAEVERAARGIVAARERSQSVDTLEAVLCPHVTRPYARPQLVDAAARAGLACPRAPHP